MEAEHCKQEPLSAAPMYPPETHITDAGEALMHGLTTKGTGNTRDEHCMDWQARLYRKRARESATLSLLEAIDGECEEMELSLRQSLTMLSVGSPSKLSSRPDSAGNRSVRCRTSLALLDIVGEPSTDYLTPPALGMPMAAVNHVIGAVAPEGAEQASLDRNESGHLAVVVSKPTSGVTARRSANKAASITEQILTTAAVAHNQKDWTNKNSLFNKRGDELMDCPLQGYNHAQLSRRKGKQGTRAIICPDPAHTPALTDGGLLALMPPSRLSRMGSLTDMMANPRDNTATMASGLIDTLVSENQAPSSTLTVSRGDCNSLQQQPSAALATLPGKHDTPSTNLHAAELRGISFSSIFPSHNMAGARVSWLNFSFPSSRISQGTGSLGMSQDLQRASITLDVDVSQSYLPRRSTRFNSLSHILDLIAPSQDIVNNESARGTCMPDGQIGSDMDGYGLPRISTAQLPGSLLASCQDLLPLTADHPLRRSRTIVSDSGALQQPGSSCLLPPYQISRQSQACLALMMTTFDSSERLELELQPLAAVPAKQSAIQKAADSEAATISDPGACQVQNHVPEPCGATGEPNDDELKCRVPGYLQPKQQEAHNMSEGTGLDPDAPMDAAGFQEEEGATEDGGEEVLNIAGSTDITKSVLITLYHLPINEAAKALGMGVTVFKKACRHFNITKWPYRKLASLDKLIETVQQDVLDDPGMVATATSLLARLDMCRKEIYKNVEMPLPDDIKRLRQANFKNEYKFRMRQEKNSQKMVLD